MNFCVYLNSTWIMEFLKHIIDYFFIIQSIYTGVLFCGWLFTLFVDSFYFVKWLNVLSKIDHSLCFSYFSFTSIFNALDTHLLDIPLAEKYDIDNKYIVWSSLLIYLYHIRLFHCVIISLCDFDWQDTQLCISVNVNIPLVQLLEILEKQRRCR